jgi:hypothetical protein
VRHGNRLSEGIGFEIRIIERQQSSDFTVSVRWAVKVLETILKPVSR